MNWIESRLTMHGVEQRLPGAIFAVAGIAGVAFGWNFGLGSMSRPGAALFPLIISAQCLLVGIWLLCRPPEMKSPDWGSFGHAVPILGALLIFSATVDRWGLIISVMLAVLVVLGGRSLRQPAESLAIAAATAGLVSAIFVLGLGLPIGLVP